MRARSGSPPVMSTSGSNGLNSSVSNRSYWLDRGQRAGNELPRRESAALPPERNVLRVGERHARYRRWWVGAEGLVEIEGRAHRLAIEHDPRGAGHSPDHLGQPIAARLGEQRGPGVGTGRVRLAGRVEEQLRQAEDVLVGRPALVLHVRPAVGDPVVALELVDRQVVEEQVQHRRRASGDARLAVLGQQDEGLDVLLVVDVGVPLGEPEADLLVEPCLDALTPASFVLAPVGGLSP